MHNGDRPTLDAVQSGMGNAPVFRADSTPIERGPVQAQKIIPMDHFRVQSTSDDGKTIESTNYDVPMEFYPKTGVDYNRDSVLNQ
jgi:hypothetical protein